MVTQPNSTQSPINTCPVCGHGKLHPHSKGWKCNNTTCKYILFAKSHGTTLTEEDARRLTNGWVTACKECTNAKGRKYAARFKLSADGQLFLAPARSQSVSLQCPSCGGSIRENSKCYYCEQVGTHNCSFIVWKEWHSHQFSRSDLTSLLTNRATPVFTDFKDKQGKIVVARIILDEHNKPIFRKSNNKR